MLVELKTKEIKEIKEKWHTAQNNICPILKREFPLDEMVLDHQHKLKSEEPDETGKGLCRGAIQRFANALEGKIVNNFKRMGLDKFIDLPTFLRNLADYLEENHIQDTVKYVHPLEVRKDPKMSKKNYNKVKKLYNAEEFIPKRKNQKKKPFPEYPKSSKATKQLREIFLRFDVSLFN